jgi:hypothetical protein
VSFKIFKNVSRITCLLLLVVNCIFSQQEGNEESSSDSIFQDTLITVRDTFALPSENLDNSDLLANITLSHAVNLLLYKSQRIKIKKEEEEEARLKWISKKRKLLPSLELIADAPRYLYEESELYFLSLPNPVYEWKKDKGFTTYLRISQPMPFGGKFVIVPYSAMSVQRFLNYAPRDLHVQELLLYYRQPIIPETSEDFEVKKAYSEYNLKRASQQIEKVNALLDMMSVYMSCYAASVKLETAVKLSKMSNDFLEYAEEEREKRRG